MSFLRWLMRLIYGLLALLCFVAGVYFAADNPDVIAPRLAGFALPEGGVGFWLIGFLLIGLLLGFVASLLPFYAERRRARGLERQLQRLERELHTVRRQVSGD
ncbi:lipopolysaccharide assembly protein LapA domain-containing protein [Microbulbifer thermotolerans]|uniref:lipopolysaccharide assembly protein LapA domain-containing protein n=1 Tax=Microbulbifer thermotolerans TaxID=252514 RepID=UPI00224B9C7F|nr:lipopolysaccharide assembly protein LapA domain-containing protein [Microbulbifer thermotolerans]MCX2842176.1 lipopolysaccharide assembly protein LapA domain-containing protein [Microbulbifer thermotolerans]